MWPPDTTERVADDGAEGIRLMRVVSYLIPDYH